MLVSSLSLLRDFLRNRRGNVAMLYALACLPLAIAAGASLDFARAVIVRASLTEALDAAGLAVGGSGNLSTADATTLAQSFFNANYDIDNTYGSPAPVSVAQNGQDITLSTSVSMPTTLMKLAGVTQMPVTASVVVTRNSKNIEVALALDTTGSMSGQRIADLQTAADDLIDMVVQDVQSPTYSKVAVAPYTMGVNVGSYATQVRGAIAAGIAVTGATKQNPVVVTAPGHTFVNGDYVVFSGIAGMTQLNGNMYKVGSVNGSKFSLYDPSYGTAVNGTAYSAYTSGGTAYCTKLGCEYYRFQNANSSYVNPAFHVSTCVTERTTGAFTDDPPSTTLLGANYPATSNPCITSTIVPLSSNRTVLKAAVDGLSASGSTAGHIGIAWAWYLLSPNFGYLWSSASQPAAYNADNLMKFAVIMTDGAFNTPYCNGVISKDATTGSGNTSDHINCNAPNGSSISQAKQLCAAMKAKGIVIYTVGFDVGTDATALDVLNYCASDAAHAYFPATGSDLKNAFHDIAQQITNLRLKS